MRTFSLLIMLLVFTSVSAQERTYVDSRGRTHLIGPFDLETLVNDSIYSGWYRKAQDQFEIENKKYGWAKNLKDAKVTIYLGTWCGDSKYYVPRFLEAWETAGLDKDQVQLVGLYGWGVPEKYKQGPNQEEKGKGIHRVPTFVFERDGEEFARIVESPVNDLITDLAQIALGYPSIPNYPGANYMLSIFEDHSDTEWEMDRMARYLGRLVRKRSELNTLGYVLMESGRMHEALKVFELNTLIYPYQHQVYDSYAEALIKNGDSVRGKAYYERVLLLDRFNENATEQLEELQGQ